MRRDRRRELTSRGRGCGDIQPTCAAGVISIRSGRVFVPLRGTLTLLLEDPPQRVDIEPGGLVAVHPGTPMQVRNETDEEILFFAFGAPPDHGNADFLDDVPGL